MFKSVRWPALSGRTRFWGSRSIVLHISPCFLLCDVECCADGSYVQEPDLSGQVTALKWPTEHRAPLCRNPILGLPFPPEFLLANSQAVRYESLPTFPGAIWSLGHLPGWVQALEIKGTNRKTDDAERCWLCDLLCHK